MKIHRDYFGTTRTGKQVDVITMENSPGASLQVITFGARIITCSMPDRDGTVDDVIVGEKDLQAYEDSLAYHGATIGRYTNRIAQGTFEIDGTSCELVKNHPLFQLHGGPDGLHNKVWEAFPIKLSDRCIVKFSLTSPDGDQGFPGNLDVSVSMSLTESNEVIIEYESVTDKDTYTSHTNHAYWNLSGAKALETIHNHVVELGSDAYVEVTEDLLPTGAFVPVENTPFDFTKPKEIGKDLNSIPGFPGFDHNFVLKRRHSQELVSAAVVKEPKSGRVLKVETDAPGMQFYTDNFSDPPYYGICLETGEMPDAMHHAQFPQPFHPAGSAYRQKTVFSFSAE